MIHVLNNKLCELAQRHRFDENNIFRHAVAAKPGEEFASSIITIIIVIVITSSITSATIIPIINAIYYLVCLC